MRNLINVVLAMVCAMFLVACGGASAGNTGDNSVISHAQLDAAKATLDVQADKTTFKPAMVGEYFVHLSDGSKEVFIDRKDIAKIFFNGDGVGWHVANPLKGIDLQYDGSLNPAFTIAGQPLSAVFGSNFSFLTKNGKELSQITDAKWLSLVVGAGMVAEIKSDSLIYGANTSVDITDPTPVITAKTVVNVNTVTGVVEITPVIVSGKIRNLVDSNPVEQVLDANDNIISGYRIAWNDNGSWYPSGGKVSALQIGMTSIAGAAKALGSGAGMPYLVRPDGSYIPFNTDPTVCTFKVNDVLTKVDANGIMPY